MREVRAVIAFAMLTACAPVAEDVPTYRDLSVPITSVALFDPTQFSGPWDVVAAFGPSPCRITVVDHGGGALDVARMGCGDDTRQVVPAKISGPGRFSLQDGPVYWVMWVDQTYRTAVIGTPNGEFGMILNRGRDIPRDRLKAAREILDWNGYDLARLVLGQTGG